MAKQVVRGEVLSPEVVSGVLVVAARVEATQEPGSVGRRAEAEVERLHTALEDLTRELGSAARELETQRRAAEAEMLRTHLLVVADDELRTRAERAIREGPRSAGDAVRQVMAQIAGRLEGSGDAVFAERAADVRDLEAQLLSRLTTRGGSDLARLLGGVSRPVLGVPELLPSLVVQGRAFGVRGFVVEQGTSFSHAAILAAASGVPVLRVADLGALLPLAGSEVLLDGNQGELIVDPSAAEVRERGRPQAAAVVTRPSGRAAARLWLNIAAAEELSSVSWEGVEGVGLYRTEMLFMGQGTSFPSEERQLAAYRRLFELCGERPAVVRTADVGGDKPLPYLRLGPQDNPHLGLRGHRLYRYHPELLVTQLRALLRAAVGAHHLRVLYPMVETVESLSFIQDLVREAVDSLRRDGLPFQERFEQGILVETPSAVWCFEALLARVDFASVGTNDLVQYLFAAERGNANVRGFYRPAHPVVLQMLRHLAEVARTAGKRLTLCGEIASDPFLLPLLVGLGMEDVSVAVGRAQRVLAVLSQLEPERCRDLAARALRGTTAADVDQALRAWHPTPPVATGAVEAEAAAIDPVCGMAVEEAGNPYRLAAGERELFFCSPSCLARYRRRTSEADSSAPGRG